MTSHSSSRIAAVLFVCGLALTACDSKTPTSAALRQASIRMQGLVPNGSSGPSVAERNKAYSEVIKNLGDTAEKGRNGETAAAYLMISQAQSGLAETPAASAAEQIGRASCRERGEIS